MQKLRSISKIEDITPEVARREFLAWVGASSLLAFTGCNVHIETNAKRMINKADKAKNVFDLAEVAEHRMGEESFSYLEGGADDLLTVQTNMDAYKKLEIRARRLVDVQNIDTKLRLFDRDLTTPVLLAPVGLQEFFHKEGELASAKAAAKLNHQMVVSTVSNFSVGEIAKAGGKEVWFQLYPTPDRKITRELLKRAENAGCSVLFLTVDTPVLGNREQHSDTLNRLLQSGELPLGNYEGIRNDEPITDSSMTWDMVAWLKENTNMKIVLKGIVTQEDAKLSVKYDTDGIVVSNHGGRQLESNRATIGCLSEVVEAVHGKIPVLIDGGIRRGTDIFKALALGADAVCIGRPFCYGLGAFGQKGVEKALTLLQAELILTMQLAGTVSLEKITRDYLK
ncbi:MAG: alpha-hydroxy acid oxidase [Candidatus Marinimicrobia bacterium]|nr:alpha-hydroxy acid oxidase [Candidatus Neomarinimicrobiota bacterium]